jgi:hypothetical protein
VKPTLQEVADYCRERHNNVNPEKFLAHYETVGWVRGKARIPIQDWKAAVRAWEQTDKERQQPYERREYSEVLRADD